MVFPGLSDSCFASCSPFNWPWILRFPKTTYFAGTTGQRRKECPQTGLVSELPSSNSKSGGTANQSQQVEREPWNSQRLLRPAAPRNPVVTSDLVNSDTLQSRERWHYRIVTFIDLHGFFLGSHQLPTPRLNGMCASSMAGDVFICVFCHISIFHIPQI